MKSKDEKRREDGGQVSLYYIAAVRAFQLGAKFAAGDESDKRGVLPLHGLLTFLMTFELV